MGEQEVMLMIDEIIDHMVDITPKQYVESDSYLASHKHLYEQDIKKLQCICKKYDSPVKNKHIEFFVRDMIVNTTKKKMLAEEKSDWHTVHNAIDIICALEYLRLILLKLGLWEI